MQLPQRVQLKRPQGLKVQSEMVYRLQYLKNWLTVSNQDIRSHLRQNIPVAA